MRTVVNLSTLEESSYPDKISPMQAVCTSYCLDNNLKDWFLSCLTNKLSYIYSLPITKGESTIACGDFCVLDNE